MEWEAVRRRHPARPERRPTAGLERFCGFILPGYPEQVRMGFLEGGELA
jgi:hypothetical protein